ncbi:CCCH zinc finger domain protein [Penicillium brasilianum]|uniref:CCCH zinc finger domain protein n=1 Tax=Penicillium brasilianum TaxID=104259 RepID=A0A1S9RHR0_PENBI|nr:CCCH zinc finger domain protein [Penicillium brasilianum]
MPKIRAWLAKRFANLRGSLGQRAAPTQQNSDYGVTADDIKADLTAGKSRPEWVFSSYAPTRNVPRQLFGGPQRELSMEEMRLRHYEMTAAGSMDQAVQEAQALWQESVNQMDSALNDLDGAVKYIVDGGNEHPNRIDITSGAQQSPFGQPSAGPATGAFGTANAPATGWGKPSGFGQPAALGQSSTLGQQGSAFGQPSTVGQSSAFGQPSTMGQASGFGQPSTLGQGSAFGQPSTIGSAQSAFGKPAFGQSGLAQAGNTQSAFSQPTFGQPAAPATGAFGAPSGASPFTQVSQNQPATGFGALAGPSPFGQPPAQQQPAPGTGGFGQPTAPFGQPAQTASPFGQVPQQQQQPAAAAPFGQTSAPANPFGAPSTQQSAPSPFGQPAAPQGVIVENVNAGPRAFIKIDDPNVLNPLPQLEGETRRDPNNNRLIMWKGRPVKYVNDAPCYLHPQDNKTYVRIHFPDGPPDDASLRDSQPNPEDYTPEIEEMYKFFLENGYFKDGIIPPVPPRRDHISFDF